MAADDTTTLPQLLTRDKRSGAGKPKWKLITAGRKASSTSAASWLKGTRVAPGAAVAGVSPKDA